MTEKAETETPGSFQGDDITPDKDGGILKEIINAGTGDEHPLNGDTVYVHYVGKFADGTEFESTYGRKHKFSFVIGDGSVIKAWDIGVATMKRGEKSIFRCRPKYGYGKKGSPPKIPPKAALIFEIELFSWRGEDVSENKDGGVLKSRVKEGDRNNPPKEGAVCNIHLIGKYDDRKFIDKEIKFTLGEGCEYGVVEGVEQALKTFKSGERSLLKVKARYAYGAQGQPDLGIPSDTDVQFDVHLKSYDPFREGWMMDEPEEKIQAAAIMKAKAAQYFQKGKYKFAARYYGHIISYLLEEDTLRGDLKKKRDSLMLAAYLNRAACYLKLENNLEAVHDCEEALKFEEQNEKGIYRRAVAQMNLQNFEAAIEDFRTLLKIHPSNKYAREQILVATEKMKEMQQKEKSMYSNMFRKRPQQPAILNVWKTKPKTEIDENTNDDISSNSQSESVTGTSPDNFEQHPVH